MIQERILVIKLCCIGDIIFMTPALRTLREHYPNAHISFMASRWVKDIVERITYVDEIILFDAPYEKNSWLIRYWATIKIMRVIQRSKFDVAILGHRSSVFSTIAFLAGVKKRIGFAGARFLTLRAPFDDTAHETQRYMSLVAALVGEQLHGPFETEIAAKPSDLKFAQELLHKVDKSEKKKYVGIFPGGGENPGTSMAIKRWYPDRYARLMSILYAELNLVPVMLGGVTDGNVVNETLANLPPDVPSINAVGVGTIGDLCGILKECSVVIGGDSGPIHMAAALGVPTVSIFGPSDPRLVAPIGVKHLHIWKKISCSPCYTPKTVMDRSYYKGNEFSCWTGTHECIYQIEVEEVLNAVKRVLDPGKGASQ
jgi:lipopolysaccharide heptosyltransferase II